MSKRSRSASTWLDLLSPELCQQIALYVSNAQPSRDMLHLAEVSPVQSKAVASALSYSLQDWAKAHSKDELDYRRRELPDLTDEEWEAMLGERIKRKEAVRVRWITTMRPFVRIISDDFPELLGAPNLRKLTMMFEHPPSLSSRNEFLKKLALVASQPGSGVSIRELSIYTDTRTLPELLFAALSALRLTRLEVDSVSWAFFPYLDNESVGRGGKSLADCCPLLQSLRLRVMGFISFQQVSEVLPRFRNLKQLGLEGFLYPLPKPMLEWLKSLDAVDLGKLMSPSGELALTVGTALRFFCGNILIREAIVPKVSRCRLEKLDVWVDVRAELSFLENIQGFTALKAVHLRWDCTPDNERTKREYYEVGFYETRRGVLLNIVKGLPMLTELKLTQVRLAISELKAILKQLGRRLEVFGTSICGQDDRALDREEAVLRGVIKYNPCLRVLDMASTYGMFDHSRRVSRKLTDQGRRILWLTERLQLRTPQMCMPDLKLLHRNFWNW